MADQFSDISNESWLGRIGNAIIGVLFGFVLIIGSIVLLSYNEGRALTTAKSLKEGAAAVVSIEPSPLDKANDKKLVHVTGDAATTEVLSDPTFAISASALRLSRTVAMYQWKEDKKTETKKQLGGGTETVTTYNYEKTWSDQRIDSSAFKHPGDHANPAAMLAGNNTVLAQKATLGAFQLNPGLIGKMNGDEPLIPTDADIAKLSPTLKDKAKLGSDGFYFGADPSAPAIGDQRVTFKILKPGTFSVIAQQTGDTFAPYPTHAGRDIERVESGVVEAASMFKHAESENAMLTWGLRALGFVLSSIGIGLIVRPIVVFADVIPIVGNILGAGVGLAAMALGMAVTLITIAVAWIAVRPVLGGALLVLAIAALHFGHRLGARKKALAAPAASPAPAS